MPSIGYKATHKSLRDVIIGKIAYGVMVYYTTTSGVIISELSKSRGP